MLLRKIESFLSRTGMAVTKFGRLAAHDPRLILDLRMGREPRPAMVDRVEHFMNTFAAEVASEVGEIGHAG